MLVFIILSDWVLKRERVPLRVYFIAWGLHRAEIGDGWVGGVVGVSSALFGAL